MHVVCGGWQKFRFSDHEMKHCCCGTQRTHCAWKWIAKQLPGQIHANGFNEVSAQKLRTMLKHPCSWRARGNVGGMRSEAWHKTSTSEKRLCTFAEPLGGLTRTLHCSSIVFFVSGLFPSCVRHHNFALPTFVDPAFLKV